MKLITKLNDDFLYLQNFLEKDLAEKFFKFLKEKIKYEKRQITIFGKTYFQPRLIKWFGDKNYVYSNQIFKKEKMPKEILKIKEICEKKFDCKFNSVLINFYRDENDSMGKHSDDEKELKENPTIISLSFGDKRDFIITNKKTKQTYKIVLENNSLLLMRNKSQKNYFHEIRKTKKKKEVRINLTFRYLY